MSNGLLPPNATLLERAIDEAVGTRFDAINTPLRELWNPNTCPRGLLPWLAWAYAIDDWNSGWSETQQRDVIRRAHYVHSRRGTLAAVRESLAALGYSLSILEWFDDVTGALQPFTFIAEIDLQGMEVGDTANLFGAMLTRINRAKNVRSHIAKLRIVSPQPSHHHVGAAQSYGVYCATGGRLEVITATENPPPEPTPEINLWSVTNFNVIYYAASDNIELMELGSTDDSWLTETKSFHKSMASASPRSQFINLSGKRPAWIDIVIEDFERLPGFGGDSSAVAWFDARGVDNVIQGRAVINANGRYRIVPDYDTFNFDTLYFRVTTSGNDDDVFSAPKVRCKVSALYIDGVAPIPPIWNSDNFNAELWESYTVAAFNEGGGFITPKGSTLSGKRPSEIHIEISGWTEPDGPGYYEVMVAVLQAGDKFGQIMRGVAYTYGDELLSIPISDQTEDIVSIVLFCNAQIPTFKITNLYLSY